ncbi:MAG: hypothetical protein KF753_05370 [Caldilineaceae bacterium]|nr:hypothetical protein [Caldilineaceae bacterium]
MPFPIRNAFSVPGQHQATHHFCQRQTPLWVFVSFCLLCVVALAGFSLSTGRVLAAPADQIIAAGCSELLTNGGFEVKDLAWQTFGTESPPAYTTSGVFSGEQAMRLGIVEGANLAIINGVRQTAFLPNSAASLVLGFHYRPIHESLPGDDLQYLDIYDANSGLKLYQLHGALSNSADWIFLQYDLTPLKGRTIRIEIGVRNDGGGGRTALIIDDISLLSCDSGAVPTGTPTGLSALATPTPTPTSIFQTLTPTASASPTPATATTTASTTATATPIVTTPPPPTDVPTGCVNVLENGGFEQPLGSSTGWLPGHVDPVGAVLSSEQAEGVRSIQLGNPPGVGTRDVVSYSSIRQLVDIPATALTAKLSWRDQSRSQEGPSDNPLPPQDRQELILLHPNLDTKAVVRRWRENVPSWQERTADLTAYLGQSFYIYFNVFNDANSTRTWMFLDDVRLYVCYAATATTSTSTPTPTPLDGDTPTATATGVAAAAMLLDTPTPDTAINQSGLPTQEASVMLTEPRTVTPTATASSSPLWRSLLGWLSRNRVMIFGLLLVIVLIAIFALRR